MSRATSFLAVSVEPFVDDLPSSRTSIPFSPLLQLLQAVYEFVALFRVQTMIHNIKSKSSIHRLDHFAVDLLVY